MLAHGSQNGCHLIFLLQWSLYLVVFFCVGRGNGEKTWSGWFDSKPLDGGSNQTLDKIRELLDYDCLHIEDVQCRDKVATAHSNTTTNLQDGTPLHSACNNSSGNHCALSNQIFWNLETNCNDYEIRFLCQVADSTESDQSADLSVNGGFIAMAAGLSVVVPLICVLVMQLRRVKREERERVLRRPEASGGETGAPDPPPSYEEVFGSSYLSASPVHSRNSSMDTLIQESDIPVRSSRIVGQDNAAYVAVRAPSGGDGSSNGGQIQGSRPNQTPTGVAVATISGSRVEDIPVTLMALQNGRSGDHRSSVRRADSSNPSTSQPSSGSTNNTVNPRSSLPSISLQSQPSPPPLILRTPPPPPFSNWSFRNSSTNRGSTTGTSHNSVNLRSSLPSTSLQPSPPPPPPPPIPRSPPPPFSSWSYRNSNNSRGSNTGTSHIQETLRRPPGMHISIEDFFASLRGVHDNDSGAAPPSYEEALKILEAATLAKDLKNIIK